MADAVRNYEGLETAFSRRTIGLLKNQHARFYIALFRTVFPDLTQARLAEDLWADIDRAVDEFVDAGYGDIVPQDGGKPKSGRVICRDLFDRYRWIESRILETGAAEYRLTADALDALDIVDRLNTVETLMSSSRMRTIVDAIAAAAVLVSPDYETGLSLLRKRVEDAQEALESYIANRGGEPLTPEQTHREVLNLIDLMRQLPNDLTQLESDVLSQGRALQHDFLQDERALGDIIANYVEQSQNLVASTENGRSFQDSLRVIGDDAQSGLIRENLDRISTAPALVESRWEQRTRLNGAWSQIITGITRVNAAEEESTRIVGRSIVRHDTKSERELAGVLHDLERIASEWARRQPIRRGTGVRTTAGTWAGASLARDVREAAPPQPLAPAMATSAHAESPSLAELARWGGPKTFDILYAIVENRARKGERGPVDLAREFNGLPDKDRRPSEIAGFAQLLGHARGQVLDEDAVWECAGQDGEPISWRGPTIVFSQEEIEAFMQEFQNGI